MELADTPEANWSDLSLAQGSNNRKDNRKANSTRANQRDVNQCFHTQLPNHGSRPYSANLTVNASRGVTSNLNHGSFHPIQLISPIATAIEPAAIFKSPPGPSQTFLDLKGRNPANTALEPVPTIPIRDFWNSLESIRDPRMV